MAGSAPSEMATTEEAGAPDLKTDNCDFGSFKAPIRDEDLPRDTRRDMTMSNRIAVIHCEHDVGKMAMLVLVKTVERMAIVQEFV